MEDSPPQGQKRSRDRDQDDDSGGGEEAGKADVSGGVNQERSVSEASDQDAASPDDDFQETRPKPKRSRTLSPQQNLIEVVKGNGDLIPKAVKIWVERYEVSPRLATTELLSMLFEACGAKYSIKEELLDETDVDDVVVALVNLARAGECEDYQSSRKKELKNFKENLVSFWDNLIIECQNGPLFDKVLFDKCMDYIIALSCTPPRIYRQTATLMGLQLVTSFISVANTLGSQRETTQRQLNAESKKRADGPRVDSLNKRLSVTHEQITTLEDMMRKIFTGLFVHRYRDIDNDIRMSCIQSLGIWIFSYPSLFLQDLYLKYLGWTLNDKHPGVRKASLLALRKLYEIDENVPTLGLFTERFSSRMIEMADDVDMPAAVCAIGLVKQLLRHQLIPDDDLGPLYDLLIDQPQEIRRAIGELVYDHLIAQKFNSSPSSLTGHEDSSSEIHIFRMLQILREFSTDPILSVYVIDDVWEYMKAMKDWKCIISMLLDQNPRTGSTTDEDSTNLIRLLFASIRKAVGEKIIPSTDNRKQYHSKAQREMFENNRKDITVAMMKNYPQLLRKFMADKAKVSSLVEIIMFMKLELYSLKRQEQSFKAAVRLIKDAFFKHGEKETLRSCVKAITFCASESKGELQDFSRGKLKDLEDELLEKLTSAIKEVKDGNDEYSLLVNLKRLYELQLLKPVLVENIYDDIAFALHNFRNLDEEVICFLLLNMKMYVTWSLHSIINCEAVSEASVSSLISKRDTLFEELSYFLNGIEESRKYGIQLSLRICAILGEEWCMFRKSNFDSSKLERLGYCPDSVLLEKFWKLCAEIFNTSDETDEEDENKDYAEETNIDVAALAACKLVISDVVPKGYLGPEIISHLGMHGPCVTGVIKNFITCLRKKEDDISSIYLESLKRAYQRYATELSSGGEESRAEKCLEVCRELASGLSGMYIGAARNKYRLEILSVVKEGVAYVFRDAPKQLLFLEVAILPFATKLSVPDIVDIKRDVQGRIVHVNTDEDPSGWRPCFTFLETLEEKCLKNEDLQDDKEAAAVRRRGRPRKRQETERKRLFDEESESDEDESISGGSDREDKIDEDAPLIETIRSAARRRALRGERSK
ncbi:PREDICTED: sister-chromatid cohesion protein 3 isoform X1 [Camelina sativa]|uniref:Sister-chromatid cohesion protein 3 isoform X1 n=1 Tax=Camelina sativa TaxID=90675 RepID=A0ABM0ZP67_CAMSA|nr:PREDICTED: sister-chromatid cohesion protein 3 isoform X1 [Camelina sativa]